MPPATVDILRSPDLRRALAHLRRPAFIRGARLDAPATVRGTIRAGGTPEFHWRLEVRAFEYVLLCERGGAGDHMGLLADALTARLTNASIAFTRYDIDTGVDVVRHVAGRRSGPQVESMAHMRRRHAGARLILLGTGEGISRRFERPGGERALADMLEAFETPLLLTTVPAERWGWREARLAELGVALFPANDRGIEQAVARVTVAETERTAPSPIAGGEDPLLASLQRDALRYCSNLSPSEDEIHLLVRRLRGFLADVQGFPLLGAIAAFPRMEPDLTARMAELINGRPLGATLAGRIASLPWMKVGRMPDWLRLAILRSLSPEQTQEIRAALILMLDELRAHAAKEPAAAADRRTRLEILSRGGVLDELFATMGLGRRRVSGEGIFIRFLEGAPLDELDQPDAPRPLSLSWRRRAALAIAAGAGGAAAWFAPSLFTWATNATPSAWLLWLWLTLAGGYALLSASLLQILTRSTGKALRLGALVAHGILYVIATLLLWSNGGGRENAFLVLPVLLFAGLHILLAIEKPAPQWRPRRMTRASFKTGIIVASLLGGAVAFYVRRGGPDLGEVLVVAIPIAMLLAVAALGGRADRYSLIIKSFPITLLVALCGLLLTVELIVFAILAFESIWRAPPIYFAEGGPMFVGFAWAIGYLVIGTLIDRRLRRPAIAFGTGIALLVLFLILVREIIPLGQSGFGWIALTVVGIVSSYFVSDEAPAPVPWLRWLRGLASPVRSAWLLFTEAGSRKRNAPIFEASDASRPKS